MAKEEVKEEKKVESKKIEVELVEVPTQFGLGFRLPTGEIMDSNQMLVWIANQILEMRRVVG